MKLLKGVYNLSADALKAALTTNAQTLNSGFLGTSGNAQYSDLTAEVASGNGYTTGGVAVSSVSLFYYVSAASINNPGSGGTNGVQTVTGTTGTGTKFTASVTIAGGVITAINSITLQGNYSALPTNSYAEPVTGGGLTGATLTLIMGAAITFTVPSWTAATFTAKYIVVYDNTASNKDILCIADMETTQATGVSATNGTITYTVNANGIIGLA
jgi:hypothetical protein